MDTVGRRVADRPAYALVVVLAALLAGGEIASSNFLSAGQLSNMLLFAAPLALLGAGQTIVMLTGGIDLSVAGTATAAAYIMAGQGSHGTVSAILVGLAVGVIVGLVNGIGVGIFGVQPLIMTLGISSILIGVLTINAQNFINGVPLVPNVIQHVGAGRQLTYIPNNLVVWIPLAVLVIVGLRASGFGRTIYAIGDNRTACELAGVRVWQALVLVYTLCGLLAAVAGILLVGYTNAADLGPRPALPAALDRRGGDRRDVDLRRQRRLRRHDHGRADPDGAQQPPRRAQRVRSDQADALRRDRRAARRVLR